MWKENEFMLKKRTAYVFACIVPLFSLSLTFSTANIVIQMVSLIKTLAQHSGKCSRNNYYFQWNENGSFSSYVLPGLTRCGGHRQAQKANIEQHGKPNNSNNINKTNRKRRNQLLFSCCKQYLLITIFNYLIKILW